MTLSTIQDVAEAHTISTMSLRPDAQPFQKLSRAVMKSLLGVSIHESSSMKTTFLSSSEFRTTALTSSKASSQHVGWAKSVAPALLAELQKASS